MENSYKIEIIKINIDFEMNGNGSQSKLIQ